MKSEARSVLDGIPADLATRPELAEVIARSSHVRVERIVSRGHASPEDFWYDQAQTEWVLLFAGRARLRFQDGHVVELRPGDHLLIDPHQRHRVDWTDPSCDTIWIAVFFSTPPI
jgi:cupin 2 domain-containing protein